MPNGAVERILFGMRARKTSSPSGLAPFSEPGTLTKREFLSAAGLALGASALPIGAGALPLDTHWDVIVIGGGTAGLPTALFAAERGRVLVIEQAPVLGGTLDRSTGQVAAAGTVFQQAKGIDDSPAAHYADIVRINGNTSDPALVRLFVEHAGDSLNWLAANGYEVAPEHPVTGSGHEHFRIPRYQWGTPGGWSIYRAMEPLIGAAQNRGALTVQLETRAIDLMQSTRGAITGVVVETSAGERFEVSARSVVLASGGCAANPAMFEALHGVPLYAQVAHPNSQGMGITLGLGAGGYVRGGEKYAALPGAVLQDDRFPAAPIAIAPLLPSQRMPWEILINSSGKRFVREDHPSIHHIEEAIAAQPGHRHWAVFDQAILDKSPPLLPKWSADDIAATSNEHPMFCRADSLGELAVRAGVDPSGLRDSVAQYNAARAAGAGDPLGLEHRPLPIEKPPFYAIRMQGWTVISFAGLAVNDRLEVIRKDTRPVSGLYAVGEVIGAGATSGKAYTNGMLVTPAITFGRLLGQRILPIG